MLRYYLWPLAENVLSYAPGGGALYRTVGRVVTRRTAGCGQSFVSSLPVTKKIQALAAPGATIMEVGTGWFHHDAFLLYLAGDYRVILFDIEDKAWLPYIRNYLRNLLDHTALLAAELGIDEADTRERLLDILSLPSKEAIYECCNFIPCITKHPAEPFWPEQSIDFMVSNCTLVHIRPELLVPELINLRRLMTDGGYMYHLLGHDDHWAFHDPSIEWPSFRYMQYSERVWRRFFETRLEYQNRLVKPEWIEVFRHCGLDVVEYNAFITDESRAAIRKLPRIAQRFAQYDEEELAIIYSYVLLRPQDPQGGGPGEIRNGLVAPPALIPGSRTGENSPPAEFCSPV